MKVFTTINPRGNFEAQEEALRSWADRYEVVSVNHADEIEMSRSRFPFIRFVESEGEFDYNGKKLVPLNSILKAIKREGGKAAIVNSDIILDRKLSLDYRHLENGIIIATRWELGSAAPYPFTNGYDLFIMNAKDADLFMNEKYIIGMPWWDFWIPSIAIKAGMAVRHVKNPLIFHRTHETNYDGDIWISFGERLYQDLMISIMDNKMQIDVYSFCQGVKAFIEKHQKEIKMK